MKVSQRVLQSMWLVNAQHRKRKGEIHHRAKRQWLRNLMLLFSSFENLWDHLRHKNISTSSTHTCLQGAPLGYLVSNRVRKNIFKTFKILKRHLKLWTTITLSKCTPETYLSIATQVEKEVIWFSSFHIEC